MASLVIYDQTVSSNVSPFSIIGGGGTGEDMLGFSIKMKTNTPESAPGQGVLLCTLEYFDGEQTQAINVSCNLSAGFFSYKIEPFIWHDLTQDVNLSFTYIGPGGVDGTCDVKIVMVDL